MKKKILLHAYTYLNVGDDLFIKIICERYKNVDFYLLAPKSYKFLFRKIQNLNIINSESIVFKIQNKLRTIQKKNNSIIFKYLKKMDSLVIIGGSMFIEQENWDRRFELYLSDYQKNKDVYLLGANFGPYQSDLFYSRFKESFRHFKDICFREKYSYDLFSDLDNVRLASDIVFNLEVASEKCFRNEVSISIMNFKNREGLSKYHDDYIQSMTKLCTFFQDKGIKINLISFCEEEGDLEAINEININLVKNDKSECCEICYRDDLDAILETLSNSKLIVATRFHAMILGWKMKKNIVPVIYSSKMANVINDSHFKGYGIEVENISNLNITEVYRSYLSNEEFCIDQFIVDSYSQFAKLDEYLK